VLFFLGAGPVRGFAVTLGIGIITSVFSAIFVTRILVEFWFNWRKPKQIVV
jgi:preprotein translocase subunit SecD